MVRLADNATLLLILIGAFQLGALGFWDHDLLGAILTDHMIAYKIIGLAGVWQLRRQKFA